MLVALSFVREEEVVQLFMKLTKVIEFPDLTDYFDNTYVRGKLVRKFKNKEKRSSPLFNIIDWSVFFSV